MIKIWLCRVCGFWRHKGWEELGWLTTPRCPVCDGRMSSVLAHHPEHNPVPLASHPVDIAQHREPAALPGRAHSPVVQREPHLAHRRS